MNRDVDLYMEEIARYDFFKRFSQAQLNQIISQSIYHQYEKNQVLFFHGDPARDYFFLLKGAIRLEKSDASGEYLFQDYIKEGTFFPYSLMFNERTYPYTGYSLTPVDLMLIPKDLLEKNVVDNQAQLLYMYQEMAEVLEFQEKRLQFTTNSSAYNRVIVSLAIWVRDMSRPMIVEDRTLKVIPYPLTINELAITAGTTRETAGKVVRDLTEENLIDFSRKKIVIYDEDYFMNFFL
ncbi:Crp/Fnr family transcriptional regulator [Allofustis seminis]|uniref:Crp/Fnr family transcriptional regulator n=1 Tax=Allofustis seminis TaxID=166939 RepID=UPI000368B747|nr:Crp/Fnr family transcriptional regulator [Allofustis seminis]